MFGYARRADLRTRSNMVERRGPLCCLIAIDQVSRGVVARVALEKFPFFLRQPCLAFARSINDGVRHVLRDITGPSLSDVECYNLQRRFILAVYHRIDYDRSSASLRHWLYVWPMRQGATSRG